jgi:hypothetical protein
MRRCSMIISAAAAAVAASVGISAVFAGQLDPKTAADAKIVPLSPSVDFVKVRASRLYLDMPAREVIDIMDEEENTADDFDDHTAAKTLKFPTEPIGTKVTLAGDRLLGVALDVFRGSQADLPGYTQVAWLGLTTTAVLRVLGMPSEVRQHTVFGIAFDQLIFSRSAEPDVSLFFVANRLVAKTVGQRIPIDIFRVVLPSPPDDTSEEPVEGTVRVGMRVSDVKAFYGPAKFNVDYTFNGRAAEHAIYRRRSGESFVSFTFVEGILTEFADIGRLPEEEIFQGR